MRWNVVELARNGLYAKVYRGFLVVMQGDTELGRVVIDELNCMLVTAEQATLSKPLMVRLAHEGIPIILAGENYHPLSIALPYGEHYRATGVLEHQIEASLPLKKRLWQKLVQTKIAGQKAVLEHTWPGNIGAIHQLDRMIGKVRSGDPSNIEAQAARCYWQALFGETFRRKAASQDAINSALNYGYTVMRAACARAIVSAGLNPALGLHHHQQGNPFCLADDLMEIYRPLVDGCVFTLSTKQSESDNLDANAKRRLAKLLQADVFLDEECGTVASTMQQLAFSLVQSYKDKKPTWSMPDFHWQDQWLAKPDGDQGSDVTDMT